MIVLLAAPVAAAIGLVIASRRENTVKRTETLEQRVAELGHRER